MTCWRSLSANSSKTGCGGTRRRACGRVYPEGWTTADKTGNGDYGSTNDIGIAYGPAGEKLLLAIMTRTRADDPKAPNMRPLIGELTTQLVPWLLG